MAVNMTETISRIKRAGPNNVRAVPMSGQPAVGGLYNVEIREGSTWTVIAEGMPQSVANDLLREAVSRLICG